MRAWRPEVTTAGLKAAAMATFPSSGLATRKTADGSPSLACSPAAASCEAAMGASYASLYDGDDQSNQSRFCAHICYVCCELHCIASARRGRD